MAHSRTPPGLKRGRKKRPALEPQQLTGRSYLQILRPYLARLHALYPHPLRVLYYDDVVVQYLVAFFSPILRSLRLMEDASEVPGINKYLNAESICRSTLSDANALFDPAHLSGLINDLARDLPATGTGPLGASDDPVLSELLDCAVLVDGSFFRLAADVQWAIHAANQYGGGKGAQGSSTSKKAQPKPGKGKKKKNNKTTPNTDASKPGIGTVRLNCQYCLRSGVPTGVSVNGSDGVHESTAAEVFVQPAHLYLFDSGIVSFDYLRRILTGGSHLLCNLSTSINFTTTQERQLTPADIAAGVVSDRVGYLSGSNRNTPPLAMLREVIVQYIDRNGQVRQLRLLSDLLEISAAAIGELYRQRWKIELFFRWLKVSANFTHLCSHSKNGISLSFHVAVIAALLMVLRTGRELSLYSYSLLGMVASGLADMPDILPIMEKRERERRLERQRLARKRAAQKSA